MHHCCNHQHNNSKIGLIITFLLTTFIMLLEFFGGLVTKSLALLSDSGHMLVDSFSILLSLIALLYSTKKPTNTKTFGFYRIEIITAFINGFSLVVISLLIIKEAIFRFFHLEQIDSDKMILIAVIGLITNGISAIILAYKSDTKNNLNIKSAYLHIIGDLFGSIGVIITGIIIKYEGLLIVDPIISVVFAIIILRGAINVLKESFHILMEGAPKDLNIEEIKDCLLGIEGVIEIKNFYIWSLNSNEHALACCLKIEDNYDGQEILQRAICKIEQIFKIKHSTIQIEKSFIKHLKY